ncbi:MAG: bifunctional hydroxymethylpyrimidine kinase/phosphomethylpyrimidine kinase [Acidobacteria bacterium]|nr:bifunctional hydroxymethylpyrimidine kinase/phosphomethylpyrimidine kinase [Acidobacteriota bacterium]
MDAARARLLVQQFGEAGVLVVGDVMLDHFLVGRVNRISPEAPVPVVEFDHDEFRLGGAANVAHNVRALGGRAQLAGIVGRDTTARQLAEELRAKGLDPQHLLEDDSRSTTRKLRIVTNRRQQVARVDYETDVELAPDVEDRLCHRLRVLAADARVILVSDYLKGAICRGVMDCLRDCARSYGIALLVDPKIPHIDDYAFATLVTPNHVEAEIATHTRIRSDDDARRAARGFQRRVNCESVLITRGEHGMSLAEGRRDGTGAVEILAESHLAAVAREVADVTGAGDTVISTIALGLAAGAKLSEAAELANHAAGVVVGKFGPATVSAEELLNAVSRSG